MTCQKTAAKETTLREKRRRAREYASFTFLLTRKFLLLKASVLSSPSLFRWEEPARGHTINQSKTLINFEFVSKFIVSCSRTNADI